MRKSMFLGSVSSWYNDYKYHGRFSAITVYSFFWRSLFKNIQADHAVMCVTKWAGQAMALNNLSLHTWKLFRNTDTGHSQGGLLLQVTQIILYKVGAATTRTRCLGPSYSREAIYYFFCNGWSKEKASSVEHLYALLTSATFPRSGQHFPFQHALPGQTLQTGQRWSASNWEKFLSICSSYL